MSVNEYKLIEEAIVHLGTLASDNYFVAEVRAYELANPKWRDYSLWQSGVRRELDMRLLLKTQVATPAMKTPEQD
jgi:hypothetical protein